MKIINTIKPVKAAEYADFLRARLNPLFGRHRLSNLELDIENSENAIEILQPQLYDAFLFKLEFHDNQIHVIKSEHYTDDVNVLTLEDILNNLYLEFPGPENTTEITDGWQKQS